MIVGGGIAGLVAAYLLSKAGADIVLLEAENYPGGRIHTVRYGGQYAEAGAMVMTEDEAQTISLLRDFPINSLIEL